MLALLFLSKGFIGVCITNIWIQLGMTLTPLQTYLNICKGLHLRGRCKRTTTQNNNSAVAYYKTWFQVSAIFSILPTINNWFTTILARPSAIVVCGKSPALAMAVWTAVTAPVSPRTLDVTASRIARWPAETKRTAVNALLTPQTLTNSVNLS